MKSSVDCYHYMFRTENTIFLEGNFNQDIMKLGTHQPTEHFFNMLSPNHFHTRILRLTLITSFMGGLDDNRHWLIFLQIIILLELQKHISDHLSILLHGDFAWSASPRVGLILNYECTKSQFNYFLNRNDRLSVKELYRNND